MPNPFEELVSCQKSFVYFVENYIKISHPTKGLIPFKLFDFQKKLIDVFEGDKKYIVGIKFRQGGFTTLQILYSLWKCLFFENQNILIVSRTLNESLHLAKIIDRLSLPEWFPKIDKKKSNHMFKSTQSQINYHSADSRLSYNNLTHLIIEESAFIPKMEELWSSLWSIVYSSIKTIKVFAFSTTNGADNWFNNTYTGAVFGQNNFDVFETSYKDHPDFNGEEGEKRIAELRKILGEKSFAQEILGQFVVKTPEFVSDENWNLTDEDLLDKVSNISNISFKEKGWIWEICRRYSKKIEK